MRHMTLRGTNQSTMHKWLHVQVDRVAGTVNFTYKSNSCTIFNSWVWSKYTHSL